jgi:hypothetical protein
MIKQRRLFPAKTWSLVIFASLWLLPGDAQGQESRADSLEVRIQQLEQVVDSLLLILSARETDKVVAGPSDELAALREAARTEAEKTEELEPDVSDSQSRTGNLSILNPEISVTGDFVGGLLWPTDKDDSETTALPREFEISFQSALDPYTRTKIFFSKEEELPIAGLEQVMGSKHEGQEAKEEDHGDHGNVELEEGYLYWVGLPGAFGIKAGKFRQEIGLYNRWHTHALLEVERPLATHAFLGDHGLIQTGVSLALPSAQIGSGTQTLTFEATKSNNKLFEGGTGISYLGRFQSFWDLGPSTWVQVGATRVTGKNSDAGLNSKLFGVDFAFRWAPPQRAGYRELTLKGEWYWANQDEEGENHSGNGGYAQLSYQWNQRWITGVRADWLDGFHQDSRVFQLVPSLSWWQSEWVRLRLQYNHLKRPSFGTDHTLILQTVWAIGPHKHETY